MVANSVVSQVACTAIEPCLTRAILTFVIIAEVEPDVLTAVVRGKFIIPAPLCEIKRLTVPIMTEFQSSVINIVIRFSKAPIVKLVKIVDVATFVAWVVHYRVKTTDVGVKDIRYYRLSHSCYFRY